MNKIIRCLITMPLVFVLMSSTIHGNECIAFSNNGMNSLMDYGMLTRGELITANNGLRPESTLAMKQSKTDSISNAQEDELEQESECLKWPYVIGFGLLGASIGALSGFESGQMSWLKGGDVEKDTPVNILIGGGIGLALGALIGIAIGMNNCK